MANLFGTYFDLAQLALASYSDFRGLYSDRNVTSALQFPGSIGTNSPDFSLTVAQTFVDRFEVVDQFTDPSLFLNGFSATVFRNKQTGQFYFITRGTENPGDYLADATLAIGIAARSEIISMVNYFLRLQAGAGNVARQIKASSILPSDGVEWDRSRTVLGVGSGLDLNQLVIAGHSLGGYLATIFGRIFNATVAAAFTFNAPGAYGGFGLLDNIARLLGGAPNSFLDASRQTNLVGDYIVSSVPGRRGQNVRIFEENDAHSQKSVADALALYSLFGELDPNVKAGEIRDIVRASTNKDSDSLEASLDGLRKLFLGPLVAATKQRGTADTDATREAFYQNVGGFRESATFQAWASQVSVVSLAGRSVEEIKSLAQNDVSYRYALKELNPFAITGALALYDQYNGGGELAVYDPVTGQGALTSEWLQDRAQFLTWKNQKNINDIADGVSILRKDNGVESYLYTDKTLKDSQGQDYSIRVVGGNTLQQTDPIRISFASDRGDTLQGGNYADHLYGGSGSDTLAGGEGDDYLEGGSGGDVLRGDGGDDALIGGDGADTLTGGAGDDTLQGGKGDDILQGGADDDVYLIRAGDGRDTIIDHEGRNTIIYTDANGKRSVLAVPAFAVAAQSNTWTGYLAGGEAVTFTRNSPLTATLPDGTQIVFDDYQDGEFGIQLKDLAQSEPETTGLTLIGDLEPVHLSPILDAQGRVVGWEDEEDEFGNVITDPSTPAPDRKDRLFGSDDNDFIAGLGGADRIYGGDGADRLEGGAGADYIYGEDGDDVIAGQGETSTDIARDRLSGGAGDDRIFAAAACDIEDAIAHANDAGLEIDAGLDPRGALMMGEAGDDVIVGSAGQDRIAGGAGSDVLIGGGGEDLILGDADLMPAFNGEYGPDQGTAAGDGDLIYGGSGSDWIRGGLGDDYVDGGDGDDFIFGEGGSDTLFGGAGDDSIYAIVNDTNLIVFDESDDYIDGGDGNDWIYGSAGDNILLGGDGDDEICGGGGNDYIDGGLGNDRIQGNDAHGGAGNDVIAGTPGADTLYGDDGDDTLSGWSSLWDLPYAVEYVAGDDWLYGGAGNDTYTLALGTGTVHIVDDAGVNRIELVSYELAATDPGMPDMYAPIARDSIHLEYNDGTYKLIYGDAGDWADLGASIGGATLGISLTRVGPGIPFDGNFDPENFDPQPSFETSTEAVSWSGIALSQSSAPEGGTLIATEGFSNTLTGKAGNDVLIGASRDDVLIGGPGDDTLDGGEGGDRYVFNLGDGVDVISDSGTQGTDTLVFGAGIAPESLSLGTAGALLIRIGGSGDAVYVDGFDPDDAGAAGGVERFEFADGTVLSHAQLVSRGFDLYGTDGDDTAFGTNLVDRFHESAGDDILIGGAGNDVYYFANGSGHDLIVDLDAAPDNFDTVVLGDGIAPEDLAVQSSAGMLTLAVIGADDKLDIQWQPQDGYAIERVQFADGTIWDSAMLESQAAPASQADAGAGAAEGGGAPPADTGSADAGAGTPAGGDTTQIGSGSTPPPDAGPTDAGAGTQTGGDPTQVASGEATSADGGTPPADIGSADAGAGTPAGGDTTQIGSGSTPPSDTGPADAGAGTQAGGDTTQTANGAAPPADTGTADAGAGTQAGGDTFQIASSGTSPAGIGTADAGAGGPASGDVIQFGRGGEPAAEAGLLGAEAGASFEGSTTPSVSSGGAAGDGLESSGGGRAPVGGGSTTVSRNPQTASIQSEQDTLAAATRMFGAIDSAAAPASSRNIAKPFDLFNAQLAGEQAAFASSPTASLSTLRPTQPSMQTWLDNWIGPRGRAIAGVRETPETMAAEDDQLPSIQDFPLPNLPGDVPEMQPAEPLTPEQIAQRYDDIKIWLDANPGVEPGMAGAIGSPPERNPFTYIGAGFAGDTGYVSMPGFGRTPGMAILGGQALQGLQGIREGYKLLGLV